MSMLEVPLPIPPDTEYHHLGLTPDARQHEVKAARTGHENRLKAQQRETESQLQRIYEQVPGLQEAYAQREAAVKGSDEERLTETLQELNARISRLEADACAVDSEFTALRKKLEELAGQLAELGKLEITRSDQRKAYDHSHPPLDILKLADCSCSEFSGDRRLVLALIRREITAFLAAQGENVYRASDIYREDFTADFVHHTLLDGE